MRLFRLFMPGFFALAGCAFGENSGGLGLVSGNPFGTPPPSVGTISNLAPKDSDAARKVDYVGQKLLASNKQLGLKPYFLTIKLPTPEVFHEDTRAVYVTEGLVERCKGDNAEEQLAAVLARELGKMVAEREARATYDPRDDKPLPIDVPVGRSGQGDAPDQTRLFELAIFEKENPRRAPGIRPDPVHLAGMYLEKAGYTRANLEAARPMLDEVDNNCALERQIKGLPQRVGWNPP